MAHDSSTKEKKNSNDSDSKKSDESKFVVISGITSGIGEGLLHELISRNYKVAGFGRNKEKIIELQKKYNIDTSKDGNLFACIDITDEDKLTQWCQNIIKSYGCPYMLINNAGSTVGCFKPVWELDIKQLKNSYNVHIVGSILLIKNFLPIMREQNDNNERFIINIASWASMNGVAELAPYVINKHGIEGLTKCLSKELSDFNPNIACISVSPGWVNTGMLEGSYEATYGKEIGLENGLQWANKCINWLLKLNIKHNGMSLGPPLEKISMKKYCEFVNMCGIDAKYENYIHPTGFENDNNDNNNDTKDNNGNINDNNNGNNKENESIKTENNSNNNNNKMKTESDLEDTNM